MVSRKNPLETFMSSIQRRLWHSHLVRALKDDEPVLEQENTSGDVTRVRFLAGDTIAVTLEKGEGEALGVNLEGTRRSTGVFSFKLRHVQAISSEEAHATVKFEVLERLEQEPPPSYLVSAWRRI